MELSKPKRPAFDWKSSLLSAQLFLRRLLPRSAQVRFDRNMMRSSISSKTAPKEERYFAPRNVVLARSSIERISVAPTDEATRSGVLTVAEQSSNRLMAATNSAIPPTKGTDAALMERRPGFG